MPATGYVVCCHTCPCGQVRKGECRGKLYIKEGSGGLTHSKKGSSHPSCDENCPLYKNLRKDKWVRPATVEDLSKWGQPWMTLGDVYPRPVASTSAIDDSIGKLSLKAPVSSPHVKLRIVYVADPTRYTTLQSCEEWNINYLLLDLDEQEYQWIQGTLPEMVFRAKEGGRDGMVHVYLHEFVSGKVSQHGLHI